MLISFPFFACHFWWAKRKILCEKYISYIFHVFSEARDHILILNILFFNKLRQIIPEVRSEMRDLLIFIFILKTTGTFTPVHSAGYLILRNEFRSTQEIARQNIQVSFYIRSTGLWPNTWIHVSQYLAPGGHIQIIIMIDTQQQYIKLNIRGEISIIMMNKFFMTILRLIRRVHQFERRD